MQVTRYNGLCLLLSTYSCCAATYGVQQIRESHIHVNELVKLDQIVTVVRRKLGECLIGKHIKPWSMNHLEQLLQLFHLYVSHAVWIVHTKSEANHLWRKRARNKQSREKHSGMEKIYRLITAEANMAHRQNPTSGGPNMQN